jgi:hypothetical protein
LKIKLKGRHFDTTEVIEAESQAVANTLTEHDFQDAFKNDRTAGNGAYAKKGTKVRVLLDGSTSSGNYGCLFVSQSCSLAQSKHRTEVMRIFLCIPFISH